MGGGRGGEGRERLMWSRGGYAAADGRGRKRRRKKSANEYVSEERGSGSRSASARASETGIWSGIGWQMGIVTGSASCSTASLACPRHCLISYGSASAKGAVLAVWKGRGRHYCYCRRRLRRGPATATARGVRQKSCVQRCRRCACAVWRPSPGRRWLPSRTWWVLCRPKKRGWERVFSGGQPGV